MCNDGNQSTPACSMCTIWSTYWISLVRSWLLIISKYVYFLKCIFQVALMNHPFIIGNWTVLSIVYNDNVPERERAPDQCPWPSPFPMTLTGSKSRDIWPHPWPAGPSFNITPFTRDPGLVPDQVGRVGRHAAMPVPRLPGQSTVCARRPHWFQFLIS